MHALHRMSEIYTYPHSRLWQLQGILLVFLMNPSECIDQEEHKQTSSLYGALAYQPAVFSFHTKPASSTFSYDL